MPTSPLSTGAGVSGTITIQYSAGQAGPWRRLGTISDLTSPANGSCGIATVEAAFTGRFSVKLARSYYRASFAPQPGENLLGSVSGPVLAWKYPTQIASLKVSTRRVARGGKITVSGQLLQDTKSWVPYRRQLVQIVYRKPGVKTSSLVVKVITNSAGKFIATFPDNFTATWSVLYPGNATHYHCNSAGIKVTVS